ISGESNGNPPSSSSSSSTRRSSLPTNSNNISSGPENNDPVDNCINWICSKCTLANNVELSICDACGTSRSNCDNSPDKDVKQITKVRRKLERPRSVA